MMSGREPLPKWLPPPHPKHSIPIELNLSDTVLMVSDPISPDHLLFKDIDTSHEPLFSVAEASKFFFRKPAQWLRIQGWKGKLMLDGKEVGSARTPKGARSYCLSDIELIAFALFEKNAISWSQLRWTLGLLNIQGRMWGYLFL